MKKLCIVLTFVLALSCFAMVAFAVDMPSHIASASASVSASIAGVADTGISAIAGAAFIVLSLSAASVVVLRRK